jgi:ribose transport system substrate-binding protein
MMALMTDVLTRRRWLAQSFASFGGGMIAAASGLWLGAGCDRKAPEPSSVGGAPALGGRRFVIGVSQSNLGEPYRVQMNADLARHAAAHPELTLIFKDAQNDSLRQRAQVEELAAQGIDLLLISPKESAPLTAPVAAVHARGIPVIVIDRRVDGDAFTSFVGADNRRIGRAAGKWAVQALGGKGKLVELEGLMTSSPARERHEGFWEGVDRAKNPGIEPIFEADTAWLEPNARREMESALARHARIDLVYAHNDPAAHGAYLAAKAAGREREMKLIGIDALPHEGVRYVREGALDVTFQYSTCGAEAIALARDVLAKRPVPKELILGTRMFDAASVESGGSAVE